MDVYFKSFGHPCNIETIDIFDNRQNLEIQTSKLISGNLTHNYFLAILIAAFCRYGNILHLTTGGEAATYGTKTPKIDIWLGDLKVSSAFQSSSDATVFSLRPSPPVREWTMIEVSQKKFGNAYFFNISMGNQHFSIENQRPEVFSNVHVFASTPRLQSQPGKIRRLKIETEVPVDAAGDDQSDDDDDQPIEQNDDNEPIGIYVTIGFATFPTLLTLFGLVYMWKTAYHCRCCCNFCTRLNMEKQDRNLVYGDYYYTDGTLSKNTVEVCFSI